MSLSGKFNALARDTWMEGVERQTRQFMEHVTELPGGSFVVEPEAFGVMGRCLGKPIVITQAMMDEAEEVRRKDEW